MKGVFLKDLYVTKSNLLVVVGSLVVLGFGVSFLFEPGAILVLAPAAAVTPVFISIAGDASSKWDKNALTMPLSRGQLVGEKYLLYGLLAALGPLAALLPCGALALAGRPVSPQSLWLYGALGLSAALLSGGISLPFAYCMDPEKSQIVFMLSFLVSTGIIAALVVLINQLIPVKTHLVPAFLAVLAVSLLCFLGSCRVAIEVYRKRDVT